MKIIDLLNKIANDEEVPKEIKYNGFYYHYDDGDYIWHPDEETEVNLLKECKLNDEVEIIEEDKKIEKIDYDIEEDKFSTYINGRFEWVDIPEKDRALYDFYKNKINEIIDKINKN